MMRRQRTEPACGFPPERDGAHPCSQPSDQAQAEEDEEKDKAGQKELSGVAAELFGAEGC